MHVAQKNTIITKRHTLAKTMEGDRWRDPRNGKGWSGGRDEVVRPSLESDVIWLAA